MHYSRYSYAHGGLSSLKEARDLLHKHAPEGEHLAYINPREAALLKEHGGSGVMTESGIRSYGLLRKITRPIAKILDKVVPNEIKPALPFIAAALPFLAPGFLAGIGSLGGMVTNPALQGYIGGSLVNAGTQLAQEGADKRGLNLVSNVLSGIGGSLSTPGAGDQFSAMKSFTPGELQYSSSIPTGSLEGGLFPQSSNLYTDVGLTNPNLATTNTLQNLQNTALSIGEKGATVFDKGRAALEEGNIFSKEFLTAAAPGQVGAFADKAYVDASNALDKYNKQQEAMGQLGVANTESRKAAIRNAMQLSGYTNDEIENTILKFKFATGGRVGYEAGSNNQGVKTIPINLDAIAKQLFGDKLDNLTYTQKETVYNRYYDLKDKKAKGGLMSLGGNEMDFRAAGGFVPIGKKERADDVPARLSKNEFVFTAKAVRNAGGGDIKQGAKKMYQLMKNLEARA
jgi:hypothetical protein